MLRFRADNNESKQFKSSIITSTELWENSDNSEERTISPARWEIEAQYWDSRVRLCLVNDMTGNDWFGSQVIRWMKVNKRVPSFQLRSGTEGRRMWGCELSALPDKFAPSTNPDSLVNIQTQDHCPVPVFERPSLMRSKDRTQSNSNI